MLLKDTISMALAGITVNKTRTFLTTLGIIIGVGAVVFMVSIGNSFQNYILTMVQSFGSNIVDVYPTGLEKYGGNLDTITMQDFDRIAALSTVTDATPMIMVAKTATYGREEIKPEIIGAYAALLKNYGFKLQRGRLLDQNDERGAKNVVVISKKIAEDLFGNQDPIGKRVDIGGQTFSVIGVVSVLASGAMQGMDNHMIMPFSTARALSGQRYLTGINALATGDVKLAEEDITLLLRDLHDIKNPENDPDLDDFIVMSGEQVLSIISTVTLGLTIFLSVIAAISLLVGGIGIMNIMLVTVTERTKEIGLRKAVGARKNDILYQFLLEAVALTMLGGMIGIVSATTFAWLLAKAADKILGDFSFFLSIPAIFLALLMALGTGLMFGFYPAKRAAELDPIEAMRKE